MFSNSQPLKKVSILIQDNKLTVSRTLLQPQVAFLRIVKGKSRGLRLKKVEHGVHSPQLESRDAFRSHSSLSLSSFIVFPLSSLACIQH